MRKFDIEKEKFNHEGYFLLDIRVSEKVIADIQRESNDLSQTMIPEKVLEKNGVVNSIWDIHQLSKSLKQIVQDPFVLDLVEALLGGKVYIHQSKINFKQALYGRDVKWHQDFTFWHNLDGMPEPKALTMAIFLDDISEFNSPLFIIPKTHLATIESEITRNREESQHNHEKKNNVIPELTYELGYQSIRREYDKNGIVSVKGKKGTILFFHSNVVHASSNNLSPLSRNIVFVTYNLCSNALKEVENPRPKYIGNRSNEPLNRHEKTIFEIKSEQQEAMV